MTRPNNDPVDALVAGARQYVADLSDSEFEQLVAETREAAPQDPSGPTPKGASAGRRAAIAEAERRGYIKGDK